MKAKKAKDFWGTTFRLVKYMSTRFWGLILTFVLVIAATIMGTIAPYILGLATTEIYRGLQEGTSLQEAGQSIQQFPIDFTLIRNILITVGIVYITQSIFQYFQSFITARIAQKTVYDLRKELKEKNVHSTDQIL